MFSSRLSPAQIAIAQESSNSLSYNLSEHAATLRQAGVPLLDLTLSNPSQAGLAHSSAQLAAALQHADLATYAPDPFGLPAARALLAERAAAFTGQPTKAEQVVLTASTSESYSWLLKLLCDPGDNILVPRPSYPLFEYLAALESVAINQYSLHYAEGWLIDLDELAAAITPRTRAIVVVHPNNPTGSFTKPQEHEAICAFCSKHGIALVSDEVFARYAFQPGLPTLAGGDCLTFVLDGLSKQAAMPQMKAGWMLASGHGHGEALRRLEWIADTYLSVGTPVQLALPALLAMGDAHRDVVQERLQANLAVATEFGCLLCEGGWTAVLPLPNQQPEERLILDLLQNENTLVQPGYFYDFLRGNHAVVSLLTPPKDFREGLRRLGKLTGK